MPHETHALDPGSSASPADPPRRSPRRAGKALVAVLLILVGVVLAGLVFLNSQITNAIDSLGDPFAALTDRPPATEVAEGERRPVNILLLGSDSRISAGDPNAWVAGAQRTDAIMLVHVPADRQRIYVMSIPRDSWVEIPGRGENKINAAFSYGGPTLLIQAVEQLTQVRIDHLMVTDFESFARLTDQLGGVRITIPETTFDERRGETIPAGTYHMDGAEALDYVRQRYGLERGDLDRVHRHQNWIRSIGASAMDQRIQDNPLELVRLILVLRGSVAADEHLTVNRLRDLALSARAVNRPEDMVFFTAPVTGLGTSPDGQSIVELDLMRLAEVTRAMVDDELGTFLAENPKYVESLGDQVD